MIITIEINPRKWKEKATYHFKRAWIFFVSHAIAAGLVLLALTLVLLVVSAAFFHFFVGVDIPFLEFKYSQTASHWGQLGDFVGGLLNPLLSFVALMAVVYSIHLQRKDLIDVRRESNEANKIQNIQTAIYRRQGVEASLLGLIAMHSKIVSETRIKVEGNVLQGRDAFAYLGEYFKSEFRKRLPINRPNPNVVSEMISGARYEMFPLQFYSEHSVALSRYMRSVYQVVKFIDSRIDAFDDSESVDDVSQAKSFRRFKVSYAERRAFSSIFRSQFDQDELRLIFLNCLTPDGRGLKYYVEKYSLLKGMHLNIFSDHQDLIESFEVAAFLDYEDLDLLNIYKMERGHLREQYRKAFQRGLSKKKPADSGDN